MRVRTIFGAMLAFGGGSSEAFADSMSPISLSSGVPMVVSVREDDGFPLNDQTWLTFTALAGTVIEIAASSGGDPCIELYQGDVTGTNFGPVSGNCGAVNGSAFLNFIAYDDDSGAGRNSYLLVTAPVSDTYSLVVSDLFVDGTQTTVLVNFTPVPGVIPPVPVVVIPVPSVAAAAAASTQLSRMIVADTRGIIRRQIGQSLISRETTASIGEEGDASDATATSSFDTPGIASVFNTWADVSSFYASDDNSARSYRGAGFQAGADIELMPGFIGGLSVGGQSLNSSVRSMKLDGHLLFLQPYLGYRSGPFAAEATVLYGRGEFDQNGSLGSGKTELFALTFTGSYDVLLESATFTPIIGLTLGRENVEGTDGILDGAREKTRFGEVSLGARYEREFMGARLFAGFYADYLDTDAESVLVSDLLVDDGWTGRAEFGGRMEFNGGLMLDSSVEFGGLGGDLKEISGAIRATLRF